MARPRSDGEPARQRKRPPATTPQAQENELIVLTIDLVKRQLIEGTASPTTINHFLRQSTEEKRLERVKLENENKLLDARVAALASSANAEVLIAKAIEAFGGYKPEDTEDEEIFD